MHPATDILAFPASFRKEDLQTNGATLHVRIGGDGPAVVLLHGYGETGDMWVPMAADLVRDHTVIVPDLRGLGLSAKPAGGFDKKTQAGDVAGVLATYGIDRIDLVAHDIGNMVAFQFAAQHPDRVKRLVLIDAPIPGVGPWEEILKNPLLWHLVVATSLMPTVVKTDSSRHARESGHPRCATWIPACAGMTEYGSVISFPGITRPECERA